jgi:hypothetical protein
MASRIMDCPISLKGLDGPADCGDQVICVHMIELEPRSRRVILMGIHDRVLEATGGSNDRNSPVLKAEHLGQAAGLVEGRHEEHVASCEDLVGENRIKAEPQLKSAWASGLEFLLVGREYHREPAAHISEYRREASNDIRKSTRLWQECSSEAADSMVRVLFFTRGKKKQPLSVCSSPILYLESPSPLLPPDQVYPEGYDEEGGTEKHSVVEPSRGKIRDEVVDNAREQQAGPK